MEDASLDSMFRENLSDETFEKAPQWSMSVRY